MYLNAQDFIILNVTFILYCLGPILTISLGLCIFSFSFIPLNLVLYIEIEIRLIYLQNRLKTKRDRNIGQNIGALFLTSDPLSFLSWDKMAAANNTR